MRRSYDVVQADSVYLPSSNLGVLLFEFLADHRPQLGSRTGKDRYLTRGIGILLGYQAELERNQKPVPRAIENSAGQSTDLGSSHFDALSKNVGDQWDSNYFQRLLESCLVHHALVL